MIQQLVDKEQTEELYMKKNSLNKKYFDPDKLEIMKQLNVDVAPNFRFVYGSANKWFQQRTWRVFTEFFNQQGEFRDKWFLRNDGWLMVLLSCFC